MTATAFDIDVSKMVSSTIAAYSGRIREMVASQNFMLATVVRHGNRARAEKLGVRSAYDAGAAWAESLRVNHAD